ncbi:MAG: GDSL-type esterase/lipase family protein [Thiovulaceae bacterium]|nr:GDSL-type esterase/lipase family protein [Sulfurimonadaceae bacterium]
MQKRSDLVFLGDSLTDFHDWSAFGRHHNAGIAGDTTDGLLYRLYYTLEKQPETLVLMIGINDLLQGQAIKHIEHNYSRILEQIEDIDTVVILSVLPVKAMPETASINNDIRKLNTYLQKESQQRAYTFVDLYSLMADETGRLKENYSSDGVHLTPAAYRVWEEALQTVLPKVQPN